MSKAPFARRRRKCENEGVLPRSTLAVALGSCGISKIVVIGRTVVRS
jgi:hypothetical protein